MYSVHESIRGISLEPGDKTEALMPVTGTQFTVGLDFHAGECRAFLPSFVSKAKQISFICYVRNVITLVM